MNENRKASLKRMVIDYGFRPGTPVSLDLQARWYARKFEEFKQTPLRMSSKTAIEEPNEDYVEWEPPQKQQHNDIPDWVDGV